MWNRYVLRPALAAAIISLPACTTIEPAPVACPPLPLPPRVELPRIQPDALACLSDEAYEALATRDAKLKAYAKQLEAVILSTYNDSNTE